MKDKDNKTILELSEEEKRILQHLIVNGLNCEEEMLLLSPQQGIIEEHYPKNLEKIEIVGCEIYKKLTGINHLQSRLDSLKIRLKQKKKDLIFEVNAK